MRHKGLVFKALVHRDHKVSNPVLINQSRAGAIFPFIVLLTTETCHSASEEFRDTVLDVSITVSSDPDWQYHAHERYYGTQNSRKL